MIHYLRSDNVFYSQDGSKWQHAAFVISYFKLLDIFFRTSEISISLSNNSEDSAIKIKIVYVCAPKICLKCAENCCQWNTQAHRLCPVDIYIKLWYISAKCAVKS